MTPLASGLYECHVMHRRLSPKRHEFAYRIFLFALDLDELPEVARRIPLFSLNGPGLYSFHDSDHFQMVPGSVRQNASAFLQSQGITEEPARIMMVTLPRFLGYVFNPISIWFCYGKNEEPLGAIAEVGNTFGELKPYFIPFHDGAFRLRTPKHYYVSPFSDLKLDFDFRFEPPSDRLGIYIDDYRGTDKTLITTLTGARKELTTSNLLLFTLKYPLITLKVIGLIHWHALLLWIKRVPFHMKEANPELQQGVYRPHRSLAEKK